MFSKLRFSKQVSFWGAPTYADIIEFLNFLLQLKNCVEYTLEYRYFYISKNITSYTILLVFKIVESLQCIVNTCFYYLSEIHN